MTTKRDDGYVLGARVVYEQGQDGTPRWSFGYEKSPSTGMYVHATIVEVDEGRRLFKTSAPGHASWQWFWPSHEDIPEGAQEHGYVRLLEDHQEAQSPQVSQSKDVERKAWIRDAALRIIEGEISEGASIAETGERAVLATAAVRMALEIWQATEELDE